MTGLLDTPVADLEAEPMDAAPPVRGSVWARWRVAARLAQRQVRRARGASALVVALVALPMALVAAAAVFSASHLGTAQEQMTAELGRTDAWLAIVGGSDPSRQQALGYPWDSTVERDENGDPVHPVEPAPASPAAFVPAATLSVFDTSVEVETPGGLAQLSATVGDAADPALDGRYELIAGRPPAHASEAMASPGALTRLDAQIGDVITLTDPATTVEITGVLKSASEPDTTERLFLAAGVAPRDAAMTTANPFSALWFVADWSPTAAEVTALNADGIVVYARSLIPSHPGSAQPDPASLWWLIAGIAAVAVFAGYLVVLLAGAAFSVSARRQRRSLAVAASVGASPADTRRTVLLQGTTLGLAGGALGAGAGIGIGAAALTVADSGRVQDYWGLHVPVWGIIAIVAFAAAVGTVAAMMPARAATRGDVLSALRGARRPPRLRTDRPLWGSALLLGGVALTAAGGLTLAALNAVDVVDYSSLLRQVCLIGVIAGPILFQVGVLLAGHWLLALVARVLSPITLGSRLASRDAAANPGRIVPAFGAIAACTFLASASIAGVGVTMAANERGWSYGAPLGASYVSVYSDFASADTSTKLVSGARAAMAATHPVATAEIGVQPWPASDETGVLDPDAPPVVTPEVQQFTDCALRDDADCMSAQWAKVGSSWALAVVEPAELETALGRDFSDAELAAFRQGAAITLGTRWVRDGHVAFNAWAWIDMQSGVNTGAAPHSLDSWSAPAIVLREADRRTFDVVIAPATAERMGVAAQPTTIIGTYDVPADTSVLDRLQQEIALTPTEFGGYGYGTEQGPPGAAPWLTLILGGTAVLVIGASGVALGLARIERRPDDATLTAVGARSLLRRNIAFWQALIVTAIGGITGAVAGLLPVWGSVLMTRNVYAPPEIADTPWSWLAILAIGLPLAIATASWLVPPRSPDLTRRTAIA